MNLLHFGGRHGGNAHSGSYCRAIRCLTEGAGTNHIQMNRCQGENIGIIAVALRILTENAPKKQFTVMLSKHSNQRPHATETACGMATAHYQDNQ